MTGSEEADERMTESREASHVASVNDKDPPPPRAEEQGNSQPPPRSEPEREKMQVEEEQVNSQPPPWSTTEQAKVEWSWSPSDSWVTFPRAANNPSTWISDEYGEWRPRSAFSLLPYFRDPDPEAPQYFDGMAEFYLEAARRLPIAQMPYLAGFLSCAGLFLGLNDPVTNIIVNAMHIMGKFGASDILPHGTDPVRHAADRASYVRIARKSRGALVVFMTFYFGHLTQAQAKRYLRAARHDLALAIGLIEWHRNGGFGLPLSPDCSRIKTAFRYAAEAAMVLHDPDDLVRLLASRFPCHLLDPVLGDLRRGEQLSVGRVNDILNLLLHPWSPPPPLPAPTPGTFQDADGNVTIIVNIGQDLFSTTTVTRDRAETLNNNKNGDLVTTTTISRHPSRRDDNDDLAAAAATYLTTDSDSESRLRSLLSTNTTLQLQPDTKSLKMCLLDTIHGLYIQALAMLPSDQQPRLLRAVLAGGHCYGVMEDPVTNIVVNSIWYNTRFPHSETADEDDDDFLIKATRSMIRAESSSLHGLIAILRADRGVTEQAAVACLCSNRRNLSHLMMTMTKSLNHHSLAAAAEAAKHPQPTALVAFVASLTGEKLDRLRSLLTAKRALSDADFTELNTTIAGNDVAAAPEQRMATTPDPGQSALDTMPAATVRPFGTPGACVFNSPIFNTMPAAPVQTTVPDRGPQSYVRTKVEEVLLDYGRNTPLGPRYKLGVICGMASMTWLCFKGTTCYHVNFLASTPVDVPNDATTSPPECKLFFAEFWDKADDHFECSKKPPICCPIQDYHAFPGRCFICEGGPMTVMHPPCGNYFMGHECSTDSLCAAAQRQADLGQ